MLLRNILFVLIVLKCSQSAKILGIFPMPAISHYILASKLMKGLANAGHDVTIISPYELEDKPVNGTYTDIVLDGFKEVFEAQIGSINMYELESNNPIKAFTNILNIFLFYTNDTIYHPKVEKLIKSKPKFDAVIMMHFFNDGLKVFANVFDCPLILLSSVGPNPWVNPTVGNPTPVSYIPNHLNKGFSQDSIFSRAKNLFFFIIEYLAINYYILPEHDEVIHKAIPDAPSIYDLYTNVSLVLLNSHTSLYKAMPIVPNMIEIGGYFIDPPKKLPNDLQVFLDSAKDGAVYFSMGSNLKSKDMPTERKRAILNVLGGLKEKVLWKFEEDLPGIPDNVMIKKWCPQQDILAHPNIKLFISHGGLLSTTETVFHGVPILAIPVFGDQDSNANNIVENGIGLKLAYNDPSFSEEKLRELVNELLTNPKYKDNAVHKSKIFHDRPQKPIEAAVYWVEYVIRHKGAPHLKVAGIRMPWYKYFMVDVLGLCLLISFIVFFSIKLLFYRFCCNNRTLKKIKKN